ncbi:MAG: hypothetical protein ACI3ZN_04380, partial [Candidatus Cryptobacteroides sp.]
MNEAENTVNSSVTPLINAGTLQEWLNFMLSAAAVEPMKSIPAAMRTGRELTNGKFLSWGTRPVLRHTSAAAPM